MTEPAGGRISYSIREAADAVGVSEWTIRRWVEDGRLTPRYVGQGHKVLIFADELRAVVAALPTDRPVA